MRKIDYNEHLVNVYRIISTNITRLRGGMKKGVLANKAGISRQTLGKIEGGGSTTIPMLYRLADALGVELCELFKPTENKSKDIKTERLQLIKEILEDDSTFVNIIKMIIENTYDVKKKK